MANVDCSKPENESESDPYDDCFEIEKRNELIDISKMLLRHRRCFPTAKKSNYITARIKFVMQMCDELKMTSQFAKPTSKSSHLSDECRKLGNQHFASNESNFGLAFPLYSQCVALAPKDSLELALAYANKSALLLKYQKYKECLQVIERCLSLNKVSDSTKFKLFLRKIACQNIMKQPGWEETRAEALKLIKEQPSADQKSMENSLAQACNRQGVIMTKEKWFDRMVEGLGQPPPNEEIPAASSSIKLQHDKKKGRHFVATKDIQAGEILIIEEPYCSRVRLGVYDSCYGCMHPTFDSVPCDHCVVALFCSEECKRTSWEKFHRVECKIVQDLEAVAKMMEYLKIGGLALRMTLSAVREFGSLEKLKQEMQDVDSNSDKRTRGFTADGMFNSDKYRSVYGLYDGVIFEEGVYDYPVLAVIAMYLLATKTDFFGQVYKSWKDMMGNDDILFVAELFTKNLDIANKNTFGIRPYFQNRQLMTSMNFINHCCFPNVHVTHRPGSNIIIAIKGIAKGEELLLSHRSNKDLDAIAIGMNIFGCPCHACRSGWMAVADFPHFSELISDQKIKKILEKEMGLLRPILEGMAKLKHTEFSAERCIYSLKRFFDCINVFDKYIKVPSYEIYEIRSWVNNVFKIVEV